MTKRSVALVISLLKGEVTSADAARAESRRGGEVA
jgi:hypothetical protein